MQAVNNYIIIDKIKEEAKTMGGFVLTEEEDQFLKSRKWINHSKKESDAKE